MTIEDFQPVTSPSDEIYLAETTIIFPALCVKHKQLEGYEYVRLGVDPDLRRIYFAFEFEPGLNLVRFTNQTERDLIKVIPALDLYAAFAWIGKVAERPDLNRRRFTFSDVDPADITVYRKYRHYIDLSERDGEG